SRETCKSPRPSNRDECCTGSGTFEVHFPLLLYCFSITRRRSERRPSACCSTMSRIRSLGGADNCRTIHVRTASLHSRWISTVWVSSALDDCVPEQPGSWKSRGLPSRYKIVLAVVVRPSFSILSEVKTSPFACGSICTVKLLGGMSPVNV